MSDSIVNPELSAEVAHLKQRFQTFINDEVIPMEPVLEAAEEAAEQAIQTLKSRAKELGLWALGHPQEIGGGGLPFMAFVHMNEVIGRSHYGQLAVGSISMQDSIMLHRYGTEAQQAQWLRP
ncbi:MAG: acyl-CoA dehydrogenase, partial [Halieaceae bacterium]|nr:acyl-CoA dehydrogenase [Halieaceae bacterium]